MEFRISKTEFLRGLRLAQGIADRKSTMPMLANVLLRTQGKNQLLVAATDLNVSLTAELKSQNAHEGGITLGAKNLYELIANAPGDDITLKKADNHWAEIRAGKVTYRIVGMPDRDFPKVPDHREASYSQIESAALKEMIERTLFSVCNDETRFHLNGVFFESDGSKTRMVSTDGHRLSKVERTIANGPKLSAGIFIPKKGLLEIR
jgi:DNA polymerase-3 subunit beta